jgi:hypothetical protein
LAFPILVLLMTELTPCVDTGAFEPAAVLTSPHCVMSANISVSALIVGWVTVGVRTEDISESRGVIGCLHFGLLMNRFPLIVDLNVQSRYVFSTPAHKDAEPPFYKASRSSVDLHDDLLRVLRLIRCMRRMALRHATSTGEQTANSFTSWGVVSLRPAIRRTRTFITMKQCASRSIRIKGIPARFTRCSAAVDPPRRCPRAVPKPTRR